MNHLDSSNFNKEQYEKERESIRSLRKRSVKVLLAACLILIISIVAFQWGFGEVDPANTNTVQFVELCKDILAITGLLSTGLAILSAGGVLFTSLKLKKHKELNQSAPTTLIRRH